MRRLQGNSKHIQVKRLGAASTISHAPNTTEETLFLFLNIESGTSLHNQDRKFSYLKGQFTQK